MVAPDGALNGDELLAAVTEAMVGFHQRYYNREPVSAKTMLLGDDLLACVLGGVYTDVEKTMIEIPHPAAPAAADTAHPQRAGAALLSAPACSVPSQLKLTADEIARLDKASAAG
jgi:hypothetical protein